jgi:hypothetical protein
MGLEGADRGTVFAGGEGLVAEPEGVGLERFARGREMLASDGLGDAGGEVVLGGVGGSDGVLDVAEEPGAKLGGEARGKGEDAGPGRKDRVGWLGVWSLEAWGGGIGEGGGWGREGRACGVRSRSGQGLGLSAFGGAEDGEVRPWGAETAGEPLQLFLAARGG